MKDTKFSFFRLLSTMTFMSFSATLLCGIFGMDWLENADMVWIEISLFSLTFFLAGLLILVNMKQPIGLVFIIAGGSILGISLAYGLGDKAAGAEWLSEIIPLAGICLFPITGIGLLITTFITYRQQKRKFTCEVDARVIDSQLERWQDQDHHFHKAYRLTWKYHVQGKTVTWKARTARSPEPRDIGFHDTLYVNEQNPEEAFDRRTEMTSLYIMTGLGIGFTVMGLLSLIMLVLI